MTQHWRDESGQALTEYALILAAVVTVAIISSLTGISGALGGMLNDAAAVFG
jgi:Flp pilus assembly pilin Flp